MKRVALIIFFVFLCTGIANADLIGPYTHTWDGTEDSMPLRLFRDGIASGYPSPVKGFPGTFANDPTYYLTYLLYNNSAISTVATVSTTQDTLSFFALYTAFDPTNLASGYLGDAGLSESGSFSAQIPSLSTFELVAMTTFSSSLGHDYSVQIRGDGISDNPIPEPSTMLLLGVGLIGLAGATRRKLKK